MSSAYMRPSSSYPFSPNQPQHEALQQEWKEIEREKHRLELEHQRLKNAQQLFKTEKRNWERSNKLKSAYQADDQSINSTGSPLPNENEVLIQELRQQLEETKQAAQKEAQSLQERLEVAQQSLESLKLEQSTYQQLSREQQQQQSDEVERWKTACAQANDELIRKENEWKTEQQSRDVSFQSKLEVSRERIWELELEIKNLQEEIIQVRDTPNDSDYWRGEVERLQKQLAETSQQLEDFQLLLPRNKQLLEQATVQQQKLRTKCSALEAKNEEQQTLVHELQASKETLTRRCETLEKAHQELLEKVEKKNSPNSNNNNTDRAELATIVQNATLPSDDPREWIREGRKHVIEFEWTSHSGMFGMYTGWLDVSGNPHGPGTLRIDDGSIYDGEWKRGLRDGHGVYTSIDGDLYQGTWRKDHQHGRGVYVWPDGQMFTGDYVDGLRHGKGIETWPKGARYEGEYQNDVKHGAGTFVRPDGRVISGEYQNGHCDDDIADDGDFSAFING